MDAHSVIERLPILKGARDIAVEAVEAGFVEHTRDVLATASRVAVERAIAAKGDRIIVVSGRPIGQPGRTNTLVVHTIE